MNKLRMNRKPLLFDTLDLKGFLPGARPPIIHTDHPILTLNQRQPPMKNEPMSNLDIYL